MRQPVPDLLKGIAVIAMIQVHIMEQFALPEILNSPPGKISLFLGGPFAAPVFMAVMGYFLAISHKTPIKKIQRGSLLLVLGLLLNIGLNFSLLIDIFKGNSNADPLAYILGVDILFLAGISVAFIGLLEIVFTKRTVPALALMIIIPALTPVIPAMPEKLKYLGAFLGSGDFWSYFPVFPWLAYPLAGYAWKKAGMESHPIIGVIGKKIALVRITALVVLISLTPMAYQIIIDLPAYYHHGILLFAWMLAFLGVWVLVCEYLYKWGQSSAVVVYIRWLGKNVTAVYVVQWLIIGNLATLFGASQYLLPLLLWFAGVMILTSGIVFLTAKPGLYGTGK